LRSNDREFGLRDRDVFLCAESDGRITLSRVECWEWELFHTRTDAFEISGTVTSHRIDGQVIHFFITNRRDYIQAFQCRGDFYERGALDVIKSNCKPERTFVDIGANIGNHAVFASKFCNVAEVIVFEPNPIAIGILKTNLALNSCTNVDASYLGFALGTEASTMRTFYPSARNLGQAQMVLDGSGEISCIRGDDVLLQRPVGFIKIDVEGMEFDVLKGLQGKIDLWRPNIFIEVWPPSLDSLRLWCEQSGYVVIGDVIWLNNFLLKPK
jgi:FkbM family methyltransferase